MSNINT